MVRIHHDAKASSGRRKFWNLSGIFKGWFNVGVLGQGTADEGDQSWAYGINNLALIVGKSRVKVSGTQVIRAFVASNDGDPGSIAPISLVDKTWVKVGSSYVSASSSGWILSTAEKINNANWIIGSGYKNGVFRIFVLKPIP